MNFKKLLLPLLLVMIVAISVSAVSAADDVAISDDSTTVVGDDLTDQQIIEEIISNTPEGGEAIIPEGDYRDLNNINITKTITLKANGTVNFYGTNVSGVSVNIINVASLAGSTANNVVIDGIHFYSTKSDSTYLDGSMDGYGVSANGVENLTVKNCYFYDLNSGVAPSGCTNTVIDNCYFNGSSTAVRGVEGYSKKEKGTKAINVGSSTINTTVINCYFDGWILDAISAAQNAQTFNIYNNTFMGNAYAFYFGGGVNFVTIKDNKFYASEDAAKPTKELISATKSCTDFIVTDNYFYVVDGTPALYAEAGNTAHGAATVFGPFTFANNTIEAAEGSNNTIGVRMFSNGGVFAPSGYVDISGNTYTNITNPILYWNNDWGELPENGGVPLSSIVVGTLTTDAEYNVLYNLDLTIDTKFAMEDASFEPNVGTYTITLKDGNGNLIADQDVTIYVGSKILNEKTDANGAITLNIEDLDFAEARDYNIVAVFSGSATYKSTSSSAVITIKKATTITASDATINTKSSKYSVTLKDENGKLIANKDVTLVIAGKTFKATTTSKGVATFTIAGVTSVGIKSAQISFAGDDDYMASSKTVKITVKKQTVIYAASVTKVKAKKTGYLTVTLKDIDKKVLAGKTIKISLNGKTYSVKTNSKGVAKLAIKLYTKKTYKATITFAGYGYYLPSSKVVSVKVY